MPSNGSMPARDARLLVVSPVRDEAAHFERVARAVAAQTRPPDAWVVVDDGSEDATLELARSLEREIDCMRVVSAPPRPEANGTADRLASAAAPRTFNVGLAAAGGAGAYTHLAKLDGDVELPADYYELLLARFAADPRLGLAGGFLVERRGSELQRLAIPPHHVHGALKCYSRACFEAIGGVQERLGWDTIDETYARMRGFRTRSFEELVGMHHRPWGSAQGTLRGRARHGACAYITHFTPSWILLRSLKVAGARPIGLSGAAFLYGYLQAAAASVPRVEDDEFRRFVQRELRGRMLTRGTLGLVRPRAARSSLPA